MMKMRWMRLQNTCRLGSASDPQRIKKEEPEQKSGREDHNGI